MNDHEKSLRMIFHHDLQERLRLTHGNYVETVSKHIAKTIARELKLDNGRLLTRDEFQEGYALVHSGSWKTLVTFEDPEPTTEEFIETFTKFWVQREFVAVLKSYVLKPSKLFLKWWYEKTGAGEYKNYTIGNIEEVYTVASWVVHEELWQFPKELLAALDEVSVDQLFSSYAGSRFEPIPGVMG